MILANGDGTLQRADFGNASSGLLLVQPDGTTTLEEINADALDAIQCISNGLKSLCYGPEANADGIAAMAIGYGATAAGRNTVSLGRGAEATSRRATALGAFSVANDNSATAIGYLANADGLQSQAIGSFSQTIFPCRIRA